MMVKYFFLFSATLFGLAGTILSLFNYNPYNSGADIFVYFYISLFVFLSGIFTFFIYYLKYKTHKEKNIEKYFWSSARQGLIISFGIITLLVLKGLKLLDLWTGVPITIAICLIELFFQTNAKEGKTIKK